MTTLTNPTFQALVTSSLYGYALVLPDRDPLYLMLGFRPDGVGTPRNVTLKQPPYSERTYTTGDRQRRVSPLVLTGETNRDTFPEPTEDGVRLWLAVLDVLTRRAVGIQRGQSIKRELWPCGYVTTGRPSSMFVWPLTLTLFPTGPDWIDQTTGARSPF